jgi:hypothetical protein
MTSCPDHQQIHAKFGHKINNAPHRTSSYDMGMQFYVALFSHRTRALKEAAKAPGGSSRSFRHLFGGFRHIADLFNGYNVKLRIVLYRYRKRQRQRPKRIVRSIVDMKDFAPHSFVTAPFLVPVEATSGLAEKMYWRQSWG